jgi:hypothetical protein
VDTTGAHAPRLLRIEPAGRLVEGIELPAHGLSYSLLRIEPSGLVFTTGYRRMMGLPRPEAPARLYLLTDWASSPRAICDMPSNHKTRLLGGAGGWVWTLHGDRLPYVYACDLATGERRELGLLGFSWIEPIEIDERGILTAEGWISPSSAPATPPRTANAAPTRE